MYLGIDIGGTKTLIGTFNDGGEAVEKVKFPTASNYQEFLKDLRQNLATFTKTNFSMAAIGMPGVVDRLHGISASTGTNISWHQSPIAADVSAIINCRVLVENDANLAGLSEAILLIDSYKRAIYATVSTGIGGALIVNGIIDEPTQNAEIGHMIFKQADGSYKSWEQLASGKTIVEKFGQRADEITDPAIWQQVTEPLAMGIINVSAVLSPEVFIIGGGAGANLHHFQSFLDDWLQKLTPDLITLPVVVQAQRPEEAVIYGCYELIKQAS